MREEDRNQDENLQEVVQSIREAVQACLREEATKASVADFIRISQFERELRETVLPREVKVTWVDRTT